MLRDNIFAKFFKVFFIITLFSESVLSQGLDVKNVQSVVNKKEFIIFESLGYKGRPNDLYEKYGLINMPLYGHRDFFEDLGNKNSNPDLPRIERLANKSIKQNHKMEV